MDFNKDKVSFKIIECNNIFNRFKGFMFKKDIINYGLLFKKCNSIHTFFMYQHLDIIITDINHNIIYLKENLAPNRIILPKKNGYYTYELPVGSIRKLI